MIQGGDPLGTGTGDPGYKFADENQPDLRFDKPDLLAMANAGPATNGSQFFITAGPPRALTGRHTIFGEVIDGVDVMQGDHPAADRPRRPPGDPRRAAVRHHHPRLGDGTPR